MRKKKFFGKRAILNLPGYQSTASIAAEIEDTSTWKPGTDCYGQHLDSKYKYRARPSITCSISDCSRSVDLDISLNNEGEYNNSINKLDIMIDALTGLRAGLTIERARYLDRIDILESDDDDD